jgi:hypothetical protein
MELEVREVANNDIDEIMELFIETYKKEPWNENWNKEIARERIRDFIENNIAENYCINKDNKIIGVMFGRRNYFIDKKDMSGGSA